MKSRATNFLLSRPSEPDAGTLRGRLHSLILARVCILTLVLWAQAAEILILETDVSKARLVFFSFAIIYFVSLINAWWVRRTDSLKSLGYLQLTVDIGLATLAAFIAGPIVVVSLYLMIIVGAALALNNHGSVAIASFAGVGFAVINSGALPGIAASEFGSNPADILAVYVSLLVVSLVSSYFARQLEATKQLVQTSAITLTELNQTQERIFQEVSDGIITLDLESTITGINDAARAIMGLVDLESTDFIGKPIKTALKHHGISGFEPLLSKDGDRVTEISLGSPSRPQQVHVSCAVRTMNSPSGSEKGRMLIFSDQSKLRDIEQRLSLHERMAAMLADPSEEFTSISTGSEENRIIGESQSMKDIYSLLQKVSGSEASVLISGESGTGKELIARAIHANSPRSSKPFVAINCGAIPENLIESEFFGHKKGAFTGAVNESIGLFRQAEGGTVFLDEVGELPLHLQTKLLRVLQEKAVRAVGDTLDIEVDVRIVAATNKVLKQEVAEGRFRDDLYYRLNVVNISLPALRARREDIPFLVKHFVEEFSCDRESVPAVSPEALQLLLDYDYPGNIRELENIIERALVLGGNAILAEHLPRDVLYQERSLSSGGLSHYNQDLLQQTADSVALPVDLDAELAKLEQLYLDLALSQSQGVKKNAAKLLGLNFRSFRYRLKKYSQETTENDAHVS